MLASQLGAVTVSSVPDSQSGDVGGLQNTVTNLGASIGTALAGALLVSALTTSFIGGLRDDSAIEADLAARAEVELAAGVPFVSDEDLRSALTGSDVPADEVDAILDDSTTARLDGLRTALAVLAFMALLAVMFSRRLPTVPPAEVY